VKELNLYLPYSDRHAGGYKARIPDIHQSTGTFEVVVESIEGTGLHGDG